MYIDDDRDVIVAEEFIGYKCFYNQCDLIMANHDTCLAIRQRLDSIAGEKYYDPNFLETFAWNYESWLNKTNQQILDRALA